VCDLDLAAGCLLVRRAKRGEPRQLPLPPAALPPLARYLRLGRPRLVRGDVLPAAEQRLLLTERGTPLVANEVLRVVKQVAARAGLRAHPHALRRALATHLVQAGVSIAHVRELLGHVRLDTTQRYVLVEREDLRRAVDVLDHRASPP
ncbi:MAG: tyrosine-type recombinase/integrase, partial [Myxococcales bacterium]|nr:tyrosine-type recombinase/integrase [Myxococcales bacterium]